MPRTTISSSLLNIAARKTLPLLLLFSLKDLYKAIGLTSEVSDTEIRQNQHRDPDASYVFSSKKRKEVYDRAHKTLVKIGQLRSALDLPANSDWFNNYPDYKPAQRPKGKPQASAEQLKPTISSQ